MVGDACVGARVFGAGPISSNRDSRSTSGLAELSANLAEWEYEGEKEDTIGNPAVSNISRNFGTLKI
jgi:hypothetical protein